MNVTEHHPEAPPFGESVHAPAFAKTPLPPENSTVPPGLPAEPESVSLTVAVHVVVPFTGTVDGAQATWVEVDRGVTVRLAPVESAEPA
ncbi:MAG TPA: hypothetical protein VIV12_12510 [Streptosporangiaceae bacterium]